MITFINEYLNRIFGEFQNEIDNLDRLCDLVNVNFKDSNIPDYNYKIIQQIYLLKYFAAYLFEYYEMYNKLVNDNIIEFPFNILSIGCGCGLDYYGLDYALRINEMNCKGYVIYNGVDIAEWNYRDNLNNPHCDFINIDILDWNKLNSNDYNIIIFPKSINEFKGDKIDKLLTLLKNTTHTMNRIVLMGSIRIDPKESANDIDCFRKIANIFTIDHNYQYVEKYNGLLTHNKKGHFRDIYDGFNYPYNIISYVNSLRTKCKNHKTCEESCFTSFRPWPILKTDYMSYKIAIFDR